MYAYIPLVSPLKKDENMDGFNMGEDNQIKSIEIKNGKLRIEVRMEQDALLCYTSVAGLHLCNADIWLCCYISFSLN